MRVSIASSILSKQPKQIDFPSILVLACHLLYLLCHDIPFIPLVLSLRIGELWQFSLGVDHLKLLTLLLQLVHYSRVRMVEK